MSRTLVRRIVVVGFLINLIAVIWPVLTLVRSPEPFVFGLPLTMAWPIGWIIVGWILLLFLDHFEERGEG